MILDDFVNLACIINMAKFDTWVLGTVLKLSATRHSRSKKVFFTHNRLFSSSAKEGGSVVPKRLRQSNGSTLSRKHILDCFGRCTKNLRMLHIRSHW